MAISIIAAPLGAGDPSPQVNFVDIEGRAGSSSKYEQWITVFSFAGRESSNRMMDWQRETGMTIAKRHPTLKIAYINFADVTAVPTLFRKVITPLLKHIHGTVMDELYEAYKDEGIRIDQNRTDFYLIPDWTGDYLRAFGIPDADDYHLWVSSGGIVRAYFKEGDAGLTGRYLDLFSRLAAPATSPTATPSTVPTP